MVNRTLALALLCWLAFCSGALAGGSEQTHQTIPSSTSSFLEDLQNFLKREDANRFADIFTSFVKSGGTHGTQVGLTATPSALVAYPGGFYSTETGAITYPDASVCWVIAHKDLTGNVSSFTRVAGTHYLIDCVSALQPALPANSVYLMKVTTAGGSITVVLDLRVTSAISGLGGGGVSSVTATAPIASTGGSTPVISISATPSFQALTLTNNTNQITLGTGSTQKITVATLSANRTFTLPDADSNPVRPLTCSGTDKVSAISPLGLIVCSADQTVAGGGTGILTINGLGPAAQTIAVGTTGADVNVVSSVATHTIHIPDASSSARGVLTTGTQSIGGHKDFSKGVTILESAGAGNNALDLSSTTVENVIKMDGATFSNAGILASAAGQLIKIRTSGWSAPAIDSENYDKVILHVAHGNPAGIPGACAGCLNLTASPAGSEQSTNHFSRYDKTGAGNGHVSTMTVDLFADSASANSSQSAANFVALNYRTNTSNVLSQVFVATAQATAASTSVTLGFSSQANTVVAGRSKLAGGYIAVEPIAAMPATYSRDDFVAGTNTTDSAVGLAIANESTTQNATTGLVVTGVSPLAAGSLPFKTGILVEDFATAGIRTPEKLSSYLIGNLADFGPGFTGVLAVSHKGTGLATLAANAVVGQTQNAAAASTSTFPAGVTGYGRLVNTGNAVFGLFGRADLHPSTGVATNEIDSFNLSGLAASSALPPNRAIGTAERHPIALTIAAGGNASSSIGIQIVKEGVSPQQFLTGIYMNPDAIATWGLLIDATSTAGASTNAALLKSKASVITAQLQTVGTVVPDNTVLMINANGTNKFAVKQGGWFCMTDDAGGFRKIHVTGGGVWTIDAAGSC